MQIKLTKEAQRDIKTQLVHITLEKGEDKARQYYKDFLNKIAYLTQFPFLGAKLAAYPQIRHVTHKSIQILYIVDLESVTIVRVLHSSQNLPDNLFWEV